MKKEHEILFTPYRIGGCEIKNRYVMAAMGTGGMVTSENTFNERGVEYYVARARGGVGLIITGTLYVENEIEKCIPGVMPCPTENPGPFIMTTAEMCERVHAYGSKIFAQLTAGFGRVLKPHNLLSETGISASDIPNYWDENLRCRALTREEIQTIVRKCGETARICRDAGFDGVEIHAVHEGYLLDQFALSLFNNRTDEYGGDLRGRLKFACDVVKSIKEACGKEFPVILRYSLKSYIKALHQGGLPGEDFIELGRDTEEGIEAAKILVEAGYDAMDVDAGTYDSWYWSHPPMYFEKGMNLPFAEALKQNMNVPVLVAGRMENPDLAAAAIHDKKTDLIALGRSLLADPDTVNKIRAGRYEFVRPCLGCHEGCMNRLVSAKPMSCAVNPASGREASYGIKPALQPKKILIVGAGVSGMEAARVLKLRGHEVEIVEKSPRLGGALNIAGSPDFKEDDLALIAWYGRTLKELEVPIHYNTEITSEVLASFERDTLIIATGSTPRTMKLPGDNHLLKAEDILSGDVEPGERVAVIGGGLVGCELALYLLQKGRKVTIFEVMPEILSAGVPMPHMNKIMLKDLLNLYETQVLTSVKLESVNDGVVRYQKGEESHELTADTIVYAIGYTSNDSLYREMAPLEPELYVLGDARRVRNIMYAVWDAYELANNV